MNKNPMPRCNGARLRALAAGATCALLLSACGIAGMSGPYPGVPDVVDARKLPRYEGPVATPYPAYRIDENRYFEIVPRTNRDCYDSTVVYVDKLKGIRSRIYDTSKLSYRPTLIIDAANDQYLVGPVSRSNGSCSSGGGGCSSGNLPYSTDAGRTWKWAKPMYSGEDVFLSGDFVYVSREGSVGQSASLAKAPDVTRNWSPHSKSTPLPKVGKPPLDTQFFCTRRGQE